MKSFESVSLDMPTIQSSRISNSSSIPEIARTVEGLALIQRTLEEITGGVSFKGSHRSAQFLEHVVKQAMLGNMDALKERMIGVELFGRKPSYNTGDDAIVRVTASDVRRRLQQHYAVLGKKAEVCIVLPLGKYVPELIRTAATQNQISTTQYHVVKGASPLVGMVQSQATEDKTSLTPTQHTGDRASVDQSSKVAWRHRILPAARGIALIIGIALAIIISRFDILMHKKAKTDLSTHSAPWSLLLDGSRPLQIVASDPNIEEIQRMTHDHVELSDYANGRYLPRGANSLPSEDLRLIKDFLRGDEISIFDGNFIAGVVSLLPSVHSRLTVRGARNIRIQDIEANDNLIFLGSPRSNPWTELYSQSLDFRFVLDQRTLQEFIQNMHPFSAEQSEYVPTAGGFGTGESFATISLLRNPGHSGHILIIAGTNGEGTDAAGTLITDPARWTWLLKPCHLTDAKAPQSIQLLLQLGDMAGSAKDVKIIACHILNQPS